MRSETRSSKGTALRLVAGDSDCVTAGSLARGYDAPTPAARPADRCEPWSVEDRPQLRSLAAAADACGLSLELAAVLVVERALLADELAECGFDELPDRLDLIAAHARVKVELAEPLSAYVAALSPRKPEPGANPLPRLLALPMRLTERILARGRPHLDATLLPSALAWERAAVLEGRTMSEWAAVKALELAR